MNFIAGSPRCVAGDIMLIDLEAESFLAGCNDRSHKRPAVFGQDRQGCLPPQREGS